MIPAAGFAVEAADVEDAEGDFGIDLLTVSEATAFSQGTITAATDSKGNTISDLSNISFSLSSGNYVVPTAVTPNQATKPVSLLTKDGEPDKDNFVIAYCTEADYKTNKAKGTLNALTDDFETAVQAGNAGKYYAVVIPQAGNDPANPYYDKSVSACPAIAFNVTAASLEGAKIVNKETEGSTFTYNATDQETNIEFSLNGKTLDSTALTISYYQDEDGLPSTKATDLTNAGDYIAVVTGNQGSEYAGATVNIPFTINQLDLSTATIVANDIEVSSTPVTDKNPGLTSINGIDLTIKTALNSELQVNYEAASNNYQIYDQTKTGSFIFNVVPKKNADGTANTNIIGSKNVTVNVVTDLGEISYDGGKSLAGNETINYGNGDQPFKFSNVKLYSALETTSGNTTTPAVEVEDATFIFTVTDADGNAATQADVASPGKWIVTAVVDSAANDYAWGGQTSFTLTVTDGEINGDANIYVNYKGEPAGQAVEATYTGNNIMDDIDITVIGPDKEPLVEGTDYTVVIEDPAGEEVTEIVNANESAYKVTIESKNYSLIHNTFTVTVNPLTFTAVRISPSQLFNKDQFIAYTGNDITPILEYTDSTKAFNESTVWTAVPEGIYTLTYQYAATKTDADAGKFKSVNAMNEAGYYKIGIELNSDVENYKLGENASNVEVQNQSTYTDLDDVIQVSDERVYLDVPSDSWAADWAYLATTLDYMHGYNNSEFFGPFDSMKRGDVALVLYRMSLPQANREGTFGNANTANQSYNTPFTDVDPHAYNAQAIQWAAQTGIVTGYAGTTDFGPNDPVTREQFATMLARYAAKAGADTSVEDANAVLGKYTDGSSVSDWAKNAVAWACENQIMGANAFLWPIADIERAAIAKMTVVYQPEDQEVMVKDLLTKENN